MAAANGSPIQVAVLESVRKLAGPQGERAFNYDTAAKHAEEAYKAGRPILPEAERLALGAAVLAYWNDLLRSGNIAFSSPGLQWDPSLFHLTDTGRKALEKLGRDPINPDGYMHHLKHCATLDPVSESYIKEALHTYQAGCHKATAVMVGTAAEGMILHLRDALASRLRAARKKLPKDMAGWKIKAVCDEVGALLEANQKHMQPELSSAFDTYWAGFTSHIRAIRNKSGHPNNIDPVSTESVHAAMLIFPEFAKLVTALEKWAVAHPF